MSGENLYDIIYTIAPYAPLVIFVACVLDTFFLTGLLLYGFAMLGSVAMLHATGMISTETLIIVAVTGTLLGNSCNFYIGKLFGGTTYIQRKVTGARTQKAKHLLTERGLLLFIILGRFVTFTRPLYALVLGSLNIPFSRFFIREVVVATVWVVFWLLIILEGEAIYFKFFT